MEAVLLYEGRVSNQRLREQFDVQQVQSSRMLAEIRELHPGTVRPASDGEKGAWISTPRFRPKIFDGGFNDYMDIAGRVGVSTEDARQDLTEVDATLFRSLHAAVVERRGIEVTYYSMRTPAGTDRAIYPHAFVRGGRRWHVRAFDGSSREYRNFNLGRLRMLDESAPSEPLLPPDAAWERVETLCIGPHPYLSDEQQSVIRNELFGGRANRLVNSRGALVPFVLQDLRVATNPDAQQPPEYQIVLLNVHELNTSVSFGT